MFTSYRVTSKEALLDIYNAHVDYSRIMVADATEGVGIFSYDTAMDSLRDAERQLDTVKEALRTGRAQMICDGSGFSLPCVLAFVVRPDGKVRCWEEILDETYSDTEVHERVRSINLESRKSIAEYTKKEYETALADPQKTEYFLQCAAADWQIAEATYNSALQAEQSGEGVAYVSIEGDLVFEIRHKIIDENRVRCEKKALYIQYFKAEK